MPIRVLPPEVASRIAAGEVIERPASAVKELVENSLDAGAAEIRIDVREGGRRLIRVVDDGIGIPTTEASLAFERHATSKLTSSDDLEHIATLGFRGEALASIASVAQVTLLTRHADEAVGTQIRVDGGHLVSQEAKGAPPGTAIVVENLFYNVPARLKFLRQPATESSHIAATVRNFALAFPERRFSLTSDGRLVFRSTGSGRLEDVLVKVYGLEKDADFRLADYPTLGALADYVIARAATPSAGSTAWPITLWCTRWPSRATSSSSSCISNTDW